jgi:hypothetical protein
VQRGAYGWTLRVAGWVMRAAGTVADITGINGLRGAPTVFGWTGPDWVEPILIFLAIMSAGIVTVGFSLRIGRRARQHTVRVIESQAASRPALKYCTCVR